MASTTFELYLAKDTATRRSYGEFPNGDGFFTKQQKVEFDVKEIPIPTDNGDFLILSGGRFSIFNIKSRILHNRKYAYDFIIQNEGSFGGYLQLKIWWS